MSLCKFVVPVAVSLSLATSADPSHHAQNEGNYQYSLDNLFRGH